MPDNPVYGREMHVVVWVDKDWLTNEGEDDEAGGWVELENRLREGVDRLGIKGVHVSFEEWLGDPDVEAGEFTLRMVKAKMEGRS